MTHDDRIAALSLSTEPRRLNLETRVNVGGLAIRKANGREAYGKDVGDFLWKLNGTYTWDPHSNANGLGVFDNIYQALAADIWEPNGTMRERIQASEERENDARSGVASLARWLSEEFGLPLYRCKAPGYGNLVGTITIRPDFIVDEATGKTAAEAQFSSDKAALGGQAKAAVRRAIHDGGDVAIEALKQTLLEAIMEPVPPPRRSSS